jgi:hypothetical protein
MKRAGKSNIKLDDLLSTSSLDLYQLLRHTSIQRSRTSGTVTSFR